jgi:predicted membrane-bound dolichyl-phosphate-mannose-protein mannosyltransferase
MAVCWVGYAVGFNTRPSPTAVTFTHIDGAHVGLHSFYSVRDFNELWQLHNATQLQEYQIVPTRDLIYQIISRELRFSLRWV